ncbi:MAG: hypothetical protein ACYDHM_02965 [Acidiferrobacterales bacterium]
MSLRDESFRTMLGREPSSTEWEDIGRLHRATGMNKDEAFWGVIAYLYARTKPDVEAREQLRIVLESLKDFSARLDQMTHSDRLITSITTAIRATLTELSGPGAEGRALSAAIETALKTMGAVPRPSLKDWFGAHLAPVLYSTAALFASGLLAVGLAYAVGRAAGAHTTHVADQAALARLKDRAGSIEKWALSPGGRRVYAWGVLNRLSLGRILACAYPGWTRQQHDGYVICYPNGSGHGFYLPHQS